ncbi:nucleotidyltransferase family protein [Moheibacter stercoris]|uniref:UTP-glucose-1-phosphate uridylyltransferase n=1 Tax=Moheibacter stercoris TaxID=1628251 RepID=A0ABV2LWJ8_9FLAO
MNKISLLILAGGMGSRYKGQKQVDVISGNETLMEFALFDALELGIRNFVFIINSQFPIDYKNQLTQLLNHKGAQIHFIVQDNQQLVPEEFQSRFDHRKKPLGTGHAVLLAKDFINGPFLTMNADDFYGRETFRLGIEMAQNLQENEFGLIAFELGNTLSEYGKVSRGICKSENGKLVSVEEHTEIGYDGNVLIGLNSKKEVSKLNETDQTSMNLWVLQPSFFHLAKKEFHVFLENMLDNQKDEFYLPFVIDQAIQNQQVKVLIQQTSSKWMGLTYADDKLWVQKEIQKQITNGIYPNQLWE